MTNNTDDALKACPFCGGHPTLKSGPTCHGNYYVSCCNVTVDLNDPSITKQDAIEAWNTRAALQPVEGGWLSINGPEIEAVKKNGKRVLVCHYAGKNKDNGASPIHIVRWRRTRHGSGGSQRKFWHLAAGVEIEYEPTHWKPLPLLPEAPAQINTEEKP